MKSITGWSGLRTIILGVLVLTGCGSVKDSSFEFALLGDNPYGQENISRFETLIEHVNQRSNLEWVLHVGDIKGGPEPCTDELLRSRFTLYQGFEVPFVFTPGDNDWYDCAFDSVEDVDVYERLAFVRQLFFPEPNRTTGGRAMAVESQGGSGEFGEFVENAMWLHRDVLFATVHLVGLSRPPSDQATAARRMDAALAWITRAFQVASDSNASGILIATQVDPWQVSGLPFVVEVLVGCPQCLEPTTGMERLYPVLAEHSIAFARPVVLAVGDTHVFRVDKPLRSSETGLIIENFTRVETFGNPDVHWVRVTVDPEEPELFSFHQEIVAANVRR
jgi:hypothetical protein